MGFKVGLAIAIAVVVGGLIYPLASGGAQLGVGELNARRSQVVMCADGLHGKLPRGLAERCAVLFTDPAGLITKIDDKYAIFIDLQVGKSDIRRLHEAILSDAPEKLAGNTVFETWWKKQPMKGS
ncbi:hypothetical protein [Aeromonas sp. QDB01]|uniref:hypothetical protein n=1 Tax=Aeromonas sp. QDB01 TaxID=2990475 RepID=UPI0022E3A7E6|nr:hypothetical protein [Aeromonas sp. QDB01]